MPAQVRQEHGLLGLPHALAFGLAAGAVYGQVYAGSKMTTAVIEAGGAIVGAIAAFGLAQAMFRRRAGSQKRA